MSRIIRVEPVQKLAQSHARLLTIAKELLEDTGGVITTSGFVTAS